MNSDALNSYQIFIHLRADQIWMKLFGSKRSSTPTLSYKAKKITMQNTGLCSPQIKSKEF